MFHEAYGELFSPMGFEAFSTFLYLFILEGPIIDRGSCLPCFHSYDWWFRSPLLLDSQAILLGASRDFPIFTNEYNLMAQRGRKALREGGIVREIVYIYIPVRCDTILYLKKKTALTMDELGRETFATQSTAVC